MSRKRKHAATPNLLLSPSVFLSSIAKLNIIAADADAGATAGATDATTSNDQGEERIEFTNEAIELLRICHGQFVALVSSELASGERKGEGNSSSKRTKLRKSTKANKCDDGDTTKDNNENGSAGTVEIRSIVPQNIIEALDSLEFNNIASQVRLLMVKNESGGGGCMVGNSKACSQDKNASTTSTSGKNRQSSQISVNDGKKSSSRAKKKKMKEAWKNDAVTAELLKEQERLFALSVEKAKLSKK